MRSRARIVGFTVAVGLLVTGLILGSRWLNAPLDRFVGCERMHLALQFHGTADCTATTNALTDTFRRDIVFAVGYGVGLWLLIAAPRPHPAATGLRMAPLLAMAFDLAETLAMLVDVEPGLAAPEGPDGARVPVVAFATGGIEALARVAAIAKWVFVIVAFAAAIHAIWLHTARLGRTGADAEKPQP